MAITLSYTIFVLALLNLIQNRINGANEDQEYSLNLGEMSNFVSEISNEVNLIISAMTNSDADYYGERSVQLLKNRDSKFDITRDVYFQTVLKHSKTTTKLQKNFQEVFIGNMCEVYGNLNSPVQFTPIFLDDCNTFFDGIMKNVGLFFGSSNH